MLTPTTEDRIERLLARSREGDAAAGDEVMAALYLELHEIAATLIGKRPPGLTLQATALVHEAWLKLNRSQTQRIADRNHFLRLAASAMRCVLVDHLRSRDRRVPTVQRNPATLDALDQVVLAYEERALDLEALDAALERLAKFDEPMARAVELHFFGGLDVRETAEALGMTRYAFERDWMATRAWLLQEIQ